MLAVVSICHSMGQVYHVLALLLGMQGRFWEHQTVQIYFSNLSFTFN